MKITLILFAFILLGACNKKESIIYFVRHAEKDLNDTTENPALTNKGVERALKIKFLLKDVHFDDIFSTKYDRNLNTVQPLADYQGLTIKQYEWYNWHSMIEDLNGKSGNFLICGHGDNILPMIEALGGKTKIKELGHHEYDKMFIVKKTDSNTEVEVKLY